MEAFILADRVLTKEHMSRQNARPKYLKKYDLPPHTPKNRTQTSAHRKPLTPLSSFNVPRTKDLLTGLVNLIERESSSPNSHKIEKYFTMSSEPSRDGGKKQKVGLLIRTLEPRSQYYDA
jgi:hypothetical protein